MSTLPMYGQGMPQGTDMNTLMSMLKMQAPQGPLGGMQAGQGQIPGAPPGLPGQPTGMAGAPPTAAANSTAGRDKVASALLAAGGQKMGQSGSPAGSLASGAMNGASLMGLATGKSPLSAMKNMIAPQGSQVPGLEMPGKTGMDDMSFANLLQGMPPDPAAASAMGEFAGVPGAEAASIMSGAYSDALAGGAGLAEMAPAIPAGAELGLDAMGAAEMLGSMGGAAEAAPWFAGLFETGGPLAALALL